MKTGESSEMMLYREGTKKLIEMLKSGQVKVVEIDGRLWVKDDRREWPLPSKEELARGTFFVGKEKLEDIAREMGISVSALYKMINDKYSQNATKELCLCAMLRRDPIPTLDEVNHKLMEERRPLLYTGTISRSSNCRDYLMSRIFELARKAVQPDGGWMLFANRAIFYFNRLLGSKEDIDMALLIKRGDESPEKEVDVFRRQAKKVEAPLEEWQAGIMEIARQKAPQYRKEVLDDYCKREKITKARAVRELSQRLYLSEDYVRKMFSDWGRTGCRHSLIACGEAMGCTYEEINRMLREVNTAIIYPNSSASDDVLIMERLLKNEESAGWTPV